MDATAVVFEQPGLLALRTVTLPDPQPDEILVEMQWSGVSAGTERLLWSGRMPAFPGMGYPLVPGYESAGRVLAAGAHATIPEGDHVFVPGARCFGELRPLFGGSASHVVVPSARAVSVPNDLGERATLLALAATAHHAIADGAAIPDLIIGHGVLGRLLARIAVAFGGTDVHVWEHDRQRMQGACGYTVVDATTDARRDYKAIYDASGDVALLDTLVARLARGGEIVLAGFYGERLSLAFPPAFMREIRLRIAAEWSPDDLFAVLRLIRSGTLSLDDLISHRAPATTAANAYDVAFTHPDCIKMILDWRNCA